MRVSRICAGASALLVSTVLFAQAAFYWNIFALDKFVYANGNLTGNGHWSTQGGGTGFVSLSVVSDTLECASIGSSDCGNLYNVTFPNDQCSQAQINTLNAVSSAEVRVIVRSNLSAPATYYEAVIRGALGSSATIGIGKVVSGTYTSLVASQTETVNSGDLVAICAQGTTVYVTIRGSQIAALTTTDSSITSGSPGLGILSNGQAQTDVIIGNWSGFYLGTTIARNGGGGGMLAVKWHPGHYVLSNTFVNSSNSNATQIKTEISQMRASPSQVLGIVDQFTWNSFEDATAGTYNFCYLDQIYVQVTTGSTTWSCGTAFPGYSSARRMGLYLSTGWFFSGTPTGTVIPSYILTNSAYGPVGPDGTHYGYWQFGGSGGACTGVLAAVWRSSVMNRLIALAGAIGSHILPDGYTVDTSPYVEMVGMLNETAETLPGATCGTDSSYSSANAVTQIEALNAATGPAASGTPFPHTNVQLFNNYMAGGPDETVSVIGNARNYAIAAAGPDTFGYSSGQSPCTGSTCGTGLGGLTWGQLAYAGWGSPGDGNPTGNWSPGGGTDLRGIIPGMYQVQGTELGYNVIYTPSDIFTQLNTSLHATHAIWSLLPPGTFTGAAVNGNYWGSCSSQSAWTASPSTCGGVLYVITTDTLSTTTCPTTYTGGCNTSENLPAENGDFFQKNIIGTTSEAA